MLEKQFVNQTYQSNKILLFSWPRRVNDSFPRDKLQKHHSKAVDVGLNGELAGPGVLRRAIAIGAHHSRRHISLLVERAELGEAKIRELRNVILIEQDVRRFEIAVDYRRIGFLVQVLETFRRPERYLHPRGPTKRSPIRRYLCKSN